MEVSNLQSQGGIYEGSGIESSHSHRDTESVEQIRTIGNPGDIGSALKASAHPDEDWTKVSDLAERRRIQNRIAQRNYRKKLKERLADLERRAGAGDKVKSHQKSQRQTDGNRDTETHHHSLPAGNDIPPAQPEDGFYPMSSTAAPSQDPSFPPMNGLPGSKGDLNFQHPGDRDSSNSPDAHANTHDKSRQSDSGLADLVSSPGISHSMLPHSPGRWSRGHQKHPATFECTLCSKRFTRAHNLRSHLRTHTDGQLVGDPIDDDRSRFDSSDYESDDAGYVSGTETGFGDTNDQPQKSSFRVQRSALDEDRLLLSSSKQNIRDMVPKAGSKPSSQTSHDRPSTIGTAMNIGHKLPVQKSLGLGTNRIEDRIDLKQLKQRDVSDHEGPIEEYSDTGDDNMSLRSFTGSVFDIGSVLSSASSSYGNRNAMVTSFADILLRDPNMDRLLAITTSEFGVSSGRFTRNLSTILKSYSRHLRRSVEALYLSKDVRDNYLTAAKVVRSSRHQISNLIASRYNERIPTAQHLQHRQVDIISRHLDRLVQSENDQPSTNEESDGDEADFTTTDLKQFLVSGEPFGLLKRNIRSLVIPDEFLDCIYESTRAFLDLLLTERRIRSVVHGLRHALLFGRDIQSNLSMQVRLMAAELKTECTDIAQLDASIFLETYSEYISVIAIDHIDTTFTSHGRSVLGSAQMQEKVAYNRASIQGSMGPQGRDARSPLPHEDILERIVAETLPSVLYVDLVPHWTFMASSGAFLSFADGLYDLAYPTFFSEAKKFVRATIRSSQGSEDKLALEGLRLLPVLAEMESCRLNGDNRIHFSTDPSESRVAALDRMKLWIETSTAAEWDWWPLQPPKRPRSQDNAQLSWQCSCGAIRHESTLASYASELRNIFKRVPLSRRGSSGTPDRPPSSLSNTSSQGARSTQSTGSTSTNYSGKQSTHSSSSSAITPPDDGHDSVVDFSNGPRRYIYVFLLVKASEYVLESIDVSSMTARDFFQAIRATYKKHRSLWRRTFSVFVYNHCDFIKIIKPEPETFMPGDLKFELPPDHDDQYYYRPRPTYSAPVTRHMFRHYFYGCYESDSLWHRLHTCLPLAPKCRIRNPAGEILEFFPKRDRPVATASQSEKVEVCYGIAARECRSFFRVVVYLCLIMAPAIWFVFAWLFMWGDRGDLQDATIPMTLVLAMISILWAVVHSGSDVRKDYGDGSK